MRGRHVPVIDSFQFLAPTAVPAEVNFTLRWKATGPPDTRGLGSSVPPTDPGAFRGRFFDARTTGSFSGSELGFSFHSNLGVSSDLGYAEMGFERNGIFLP